MFRGDAQHSGVYMTKAVAHFKDVKWAHKTNGPVRSSPAVTNDAVYFGSGDGYLYAVDLQSGEEKWRFKTKDRIFSSPVVAEGVVYFGSDDGYLYALAGGAAETYSAPIKRSGCCA